ncbi:MAG TPA: hypothetical protein VNY36_09770, partial [Bacteroidia bacterium]|nr:hypothetical protein [Bacteroidia bacterium]
MRLLIKFSFTIILLSACSKYSFTPLYPPPPPGYYDNVTLGTVYNGNLIVAGSFTTLFNSSRYIAQWNGTTWQNLGSGLGSYYGTGGVNTFAVYNNNLIVGGYFDSAGGQIANRIALWNGSSWQTLGSGMTTSSRNNNPHVGALAVYNGNLIAAGNFLYAGGVSASNIASWNGSAWQSLQGGTD